MSKVYVPQEPTRWDDTVKLHMPTADLTPVLRYGELLVCLPPNVSLYMPEVVYAALKEFMRGFTQDDYVVAIGSPVLISMASIIASKVCNGPIKLLTWDRKQSQYLQWKIGEPQEVQ